MAGIDQTSVSREEYFRRQADTWLEAQLQSAIETLAVRLGWMVYHTHDSRRSNAGYPDLHLVHPTGGRHLFRELKKQKRSNPTADQLKWLAALEHAGCDVGVWRPLDFINGTVRAELERTMPER